MYDAIIIGAGMSGLAAGIRLAHFGQRVCILERHTTIGGLNGFYRLGGRDHDVGLHALTNFAPPQYRKGPLARLLRQLRLSRDELALSPQIGSEIAFPGERLKFSNDFDLLRSEVARAFPAEKDNFQRLASQILDYDELTPAAYVLSARKILSETIGDPLLREMLLCPLMWYGNAREHDMDWGAFSIMFRSIFLEGFARPRAGVRLILKVLVRKFRTLGGTLRLKAGVQQIPADNDQAMGVVLDNGDQLTARTVISSAGLIETLRMCRQEQLAAQTPAGQMSFTEAICVVDRQPQALGHDRTIVFFNDSEKFHWQRPHELCDVRTGVICSPNNFAYDPSEGPLPEGLIRITSQANFDHWNTLGESEYADAKRRWFDATLAAATKFVPDFRGHIVATDMFTPKTIHRFTWHDNGAVYGAPQKRLDGTTHLKNLFLCGTDHGMVGIIGAITSGVAMANRWLTEIAQRPVEAASLAVAEPSA